LITIDKDGRRVVLCYQSVGFVGWAGTQGIGLFALARVRRIVS